MSRSPEGNAYHDSRGDNRFRARLREAEVTAVDEEVSRLTGRLRSGIRTSGKGRIGYKEFILIRTLNFRVRQTVSCFRSSIYFLLVFVREAVIV